MQTEICTVIHVILPEIYLSKCTCMQHIQCNVCHNTITYHILLLSDITTEKNYESQQTDN